MDALIERVWSTPALGEGLALLERAWLRRAAGLSEDGEVTDRASAARLLEAAAILACSKRMDQRLTAYRLSTYVYELFGGRLIGLDASLRVILTRIGNFPGLVTAKSIDNALGSTPWFLANEEFQRRSANSIDVVDRQLLLTDYQMNLWADLQAGEPLAISAPTSAGKSFLLQTFIVSQIHRDREFSACYVVPTRALITQVQSDLTAQFASYGLSSIEVISVPPESTEELRGGVVYVFTQERFQLLLTSHPDVEFDVLIVDEAHSVQDGDRGILLQSAIDEVVARNPKTQVIFATPAVSNLEIFGLMAGLGDVRVSKTDEATVAQNFINIVIESPAKGKLALYAQDRNGRRSFGSVTIGQALHSRVESLVHVAHHFGGERQSIVYANGQADAEKIAFQIADLRRGSDVASEELEGLAELAREAVHPKYLLAQTVKFGVGFHYGNIPTILRNAVEKAFDKGALKYLVCTSTLLSGVNLPALNLFVCSPTRGNGSPLGSVDFWNLAGRAGRLRREFQGNIYLINYDKWESQAFDGPKSAPLVPAIQDVLGSRIGQLAAVARNDPFELVSDSGLETIFVRLLTDLKRGRLGPTLDRAGLLVGDPERVTLEEALVIASASISLPAQILDVSPTISAHRQQSLFDGFCKTIEAQGREGAKALLIKHPRDPDAFDSYVSALERIHGTILARPGTRMQNRFFALMLLKWMQGISIAELVDGRMQYQPETNINKAIRDTLDLVEKELRFNFVRAFGCYTAVLGEALRETKNEELVESIPSVALYLEVGASDKTMVSFVSMGLSRLVSKKLNDICPIKTYDQSEARSWLARQNLESLGLSTYLRAEIELLLRSAAA